MLRLDHSLPLDDGQRVFVHVAPVPDSPRRGVRSPNEILRLAAQVYEGLSSEDVAEIERIAHGSHFSYDSSHR